MNITDVDKSQGIVYTNNMSDFSHLNVAPNLNDFEL